MKIHLEADYKSYAAFYPVYSFDGLLIAVELLTHFSHTTANVAMPQEMLLPQMDSEQRILLLQSQIGSIEKNHDFFRQQGVKVTLKIDEVTSQAILESDFLARKLDALEWLELEINESFPNLKLGKDHPGLMALSERFDLSLENYGAGKAPSKAVYDDLFTASSWIRVLLSTILIDSLLNPSLVPFSITSGPTVSRLSFRELMIYPGWKKLVTLNLMVYRARCSRRWEKRGLLR